MQRSVLILTAFLFSAGGGFAQSRNQTFRACTQVCVKAGSKYVLYEPAMKMVCALDNQKKPAAFAGQKVTVNGNLDSSGGTIHLKSIKAAS